MQVYVYSYKSDASNEPVGRVNATGLFEARRKIALIKQLDVKIVNHLFNIQKLDDHDKSSKRY